MTRSEIRAARKAARRAGEPLRGELALSLASDRGRAAIEFSESPRGHRARERWARRYDELNGAPENDADR